MKCEKRRLCSEIESYIKRDGGREKIRALGRKVARQVLKQGTIREMENDSYTR